MTGDGREQGRAEAAGPQALFFEAVQAHQQRRFAEAERGYMQVLGLLPGHPKVLGNLAALYREVRRFEEAADCCRQALEETPDDPLLHLNLGAIKEEQGDISSAIACFRRVLELEPANAMALNNLGKVLHRQGQIHEGEEYLRQALQVEPDYPHALNNLGVICSEQGNNREAEDYFRRSLRLAPEDAATLYNLAGVCNCQGRKEEAASLLEQVLRLEPGHALAGHLLAALAGKTTETAPRAYVEATFDAYAGRFDRHLTGELRYMVPMVLREMIDTFLPAEGGFARALDLGCGTGLTGEAIRPLCRELHGVDVSAGMLAKAKKKGCYDQLVQEDIVAFLADCRESYDLFVAADVFVYLGRLESAFSGLARAAAPGAILAFSIERSRKDGEMVLNPSGRYAHSPDYIEWLARRQGLEILACREQGIRWEGGSWIEGDLFVLRFPSRQE
jgi:predicted TPR repeat methyltransferase